MQKITLPEPIDKYQIIKELPVKVVAKNNETYVLMQNGNIYSWGEALESTPKLVENPDTIDLNKDNDIGENENLTKLLDETKETEIKISKGTNHIAVALSNGDVYTWGKRRKRKLRKWKI